MPGWRQETGVATRIVWGRRGANDGRTGLVSGLWYLLRCDRWRVWREEEEEEGKEEAFLFLPAEGFSFFLLLGNDSHLPLRQ